MKTFENLGMIHVINGVNAKQYILHHKKEYSPVPFSFIYNNIEMDPETRKNKGTTKILQDIHGTIYIVGIRYVWQLVESVTNPMHPVFDQIINTIKNRIVIYDNRPNCLYYNEVCNIKNSYGSCPSDCATFTKK